MAAKNKRRKKLNGLGEEINGIIAICFTLIFMFGIYTKDAGYLSVFSKAIFVNLLGIGAYILPIYIIYIVFRRSLLKKNEILSTRGWGITLFILTTILLIQTWVIRYIYIDNEIVASIIGMLNYKGDWHGGIIGFLVTLPIYKLIGEIGVYILIITSYIISSMFIFDYNIKTILILITRYIKDKNNDNSNEKIENDDYISIRKSTEEKEDFISKIDNKIKILDFMKNSSLNNIKEEVASDGKDNKEDIRIITDETNIEEKSKDKKSLDNEVKESVNKEIIETLSKESSLNVEYVAPRAELLNVNTHLKLNKDDKKELLANATKLEETLLSFGVEAKILQVTKGPSVTRFELQPKAGVKVSKIVNLSDDIALGLAANGVRIEAPIPGKSAIGIEVPNKEQTAVFFREILESEEFSNNQYKVACALGKDITGRCVVTDLSKMPHVLIAGATGSGKSVCINTLIISILYKYSPDDVKLLMVDPKVVELNVYNGIPHLLIPVVTDPKKAAAALNWAVNEMTRRYKLFADNGVRNIESYNTMVSKGILEEKLPYIVIIVDELADLMMVCPNDVEDYICRLAQMARAAGMHLVIATQRPSVDVITGVIKANIPSRISFAVSSQIDSRTILDSAGAEKLLGRGDMLFYPVGESKPLRVQGAFISEEEVEQVVSFIKDARIENKYEEEILEHINSADDTRTTSDSERDELLDEAIKIVVESGQVSTSYLQRRLRIGFNRAARIIEELEECNIISKRDGSKPRQVLVSRDELDNVK